MLGGIGGWIVGKLKYLLLIAAVGGPIVAWSSWEDGQRRREVEAKGQTATATIDGATRTKRRRSGTSYRVHLSWTDAAGQTHAAKDVPISRGMADRIIVDDRIQVDTLPIRYLAEGGAADRLEAGENVIVVDDEASQLQTDDEMITIGIGAGIVGALGSALLFWLGRRRPQAQPA